MVAKKEPLGYKWCFTEEQLPPKDRTVTCISLSAAAILKESLIDWNEGMNLRTAGNLMRLSLAWHEAILRGQRAKTPDKETLDAREAEILRKEEELQERERQVSSKEKAVQRAIDFKVKEIDKTLVTTQRLLLNSDTSILKTIRASLEKAINDITSVENTIAAHKQEDEEKVWKIDLE